MLGSCGTAPVRFYGTFGGSLGRHRAELHALDLLQQPELIEIDRGQAVLGGARPIAAGPPWRPHWFRIAPSISSAKPCCGLPFMISSRALAARSASGREYGSR